MTKMRRFWFAGFILVLLAPWAIGRTGEPVSRDLLVGKWRHLQMVQSADGVIVRTKASSGDVTVEYTKDGHWIFSDSQNSNRGTYRFLDEHNMETTILASNLSKQDGWTSVKHIEVNESTLKLVTHYDEKAMAAFAKRADGTRPKQMSVTSTFERVPVAAQARADQLAMPSKAYEGVYVLVVEAVLSVSNQKSR